MSYKIILLTQSHSKFLNNKCQGQWHKPLIPVLERQKQANLQVQGQPDIKESSRTAGTTQRNPVLKTNNNRKQKTQTKIPIKIYYIFFFLSLLLGLIYHSTINWFLRLKTL